MTFVRTDWNKKLTKEQMKKRQYFSFTTDENLT